MTPDADVRAASGRSPWFTAVGILLLIALGAAGLVQWRQYQLLNQSQQFRNDYLQVSLHQLQVEGRMITRWFLQVDMQPEVGPEAYDQGAEILRAFFHKCLADFQDPALDSLGKQIITCCLEGGTLEDYEKLIPAG